MSRPVRPRRDNRRAPSTSDPIFVKAGRWLLSCILSLVCGAAFALPLLYPALDWVAWILSAALIWVVDRRTAGAALGHGWLCGTAFYACAVYWIPETIRLFAPGYKHLAGLMFLGYCLLTGLQFGAFGYVTAKLRNAAPILIYPISWVALELLWPHPFPWQLGVSQSRWITLIQIVEITGVYGISFLLVWFGSTARHLLTAARTRNSFSFAIRPAIALVVACGLVVCFGWQRRQGIQRSLPDQSSMRVALVQPSDRPWSRTCEALSRQLHGSVDLYCWPESAVGGAYPLDHNDLKSPDSAGRRLPRPFPNPDGYVLFGATSTRTGPGSRRQYYVSALLSDPQENIIGRYHKRRLVPFGESIPGEQWFPALHRFSPFPDPYVPGASHEPLVVPGLARLGVLICYEDIVGKLARLSTRAGAEVLVNITNDYWFGTSRALEQHLRIALFRAVENRRYLLRSTTTGCTAIISPVGEMLARAPTDQPAVLTAAIHPLRITTFYSRYGDVFGWACITVLPVLACWHRARIRSPRSGPACAQVQTCNTPDKSGSLAPPRPES